MLLGTRFSRFTTPFSEVVAPAANSRRHDRALTRSGGS